MACMPWIAPMAMATTQLARVVRYEQASLLENPGLEGTPLGMSWVVATGGDGKRKLQIQWLPSA